VSPSSTGSSIRTTVDGRELAISNLDKVFYPETGFTKGQVIDYYARIAPVMLPHIVERPLTMTRYPDGVDGQSFFAKHVPAGTPKWIDTVSVPSKENDGPIEYVMLADRPGLVWAANMGAIEMHVPLWHTGRRRVLPASPDQLVFDLDPGEGTTIVECCVVGLWIAELLASEGLECVGKTSGSKGLQLYARLEGRPTWERSRSMAHEVAVQLEKDHPELVVSNMKKRLRGGKVLIDWSQNHPVKTTVAVYSLRARPEPTVSTPVTWDEITACASEGDPSLLRFTADQVLERVEELGDLFESV
jgi:bifunctional non-homologous end joining protein LigD